MWHQAPYLPKRTFFRAQILPNFHLFPWLLKMTNFGAYLLSGTNGNFNVTFSP
ncbi:hypothetical protein HOLleu_18772 [Holothuria leucospilota]|uniref:Uncharacterized protein n=1 Tax=Holothuria leucospilota TaxID=206669 RepID=A0A9Q1C2B2_HOLLE|nr:hypothetical protein HOLleu_18772 [Holothuria leucospilota]